MGPAVMTAARFLLEIGPDLARTGRALYKMFGGDVSRARTVLQIVRDHGLVLDERRLKFDAELAAMRADRASKPDA